MSLQFAHGLLVLAPGSWDTLAYVHVMFSAHSSRLLAAEVPAKTPRKMFPRSEGKQPGVL